MPYISGLVGKQVVDIDGEKIGVLKDLVAIQRPEVRHPQIIALQISSMPELIHFTDVSVLVALAVVLNKTKNEINRYSASENDLFLVRDVLDKQIIDINGVRVVRVNDLEITRVGIDYYVANVDVSGSGLLRRFGLAGAKKNPTTGDKEKGKTPNSISWDEVELLSGDQPIRLKVPGDKITELHPAELAEIISDLSRAESNEFLKSLDVKTLADTLEEVEPEFQASLVDQMPDEKVADLLEEMSPDEAADLLAELPDDRSEELLKLMESEDAEDVRKLLTYPDDSAGGIMTTEFVSVLPENTAEAVINTLRSQSEEAETIYYIYVTDTQNRLLGVFSLRQLVLADPGKTVIDFMEKRVVTVNVQEEQNDIAKLISKYNLLAVPVIDDEKHMLGIVTADDALDKIIPTAWKKRLPRFYH